MHSQLVQVGTIVIANSGATCHMYNNNRLLNSTEVTLGDGHNVEVIGCRVVLETKSPSDRTRKCKLHEVLHVPKLSYNLFSV